LTSKVLAPVKEYSSEVS